MSKEKILTIAILVLLVLMAIGRVVNSQTTVAILYLMFCLLAILNELLVDDSLVDVVEGMFIPEMRTTRAEPRFFTLVQELGLDEYWAAYGLPDVCHGETKEVEFCGRLTADRE